MPDKSPNTIAALISYMTTLLSQGASDTPKLDSELIVMNTLNVDKVFLYTNPKAELSNDSLDICMNRLKRRLSMEPIAYILEEKEFYGYRFKVGPDVLIPRPETELLVEAIDHQIKKIKKTTPNNSPFKILDIGTGSGCIAITLNLLHPDCEVNAWDICPNALDVAKENNRLLGTRVKFSQKDALKQSSWTEKFDLIVSNPPYIAFSEMDQLSKNVKHFEPHKALFAPKQGLAFYQFFSKWAHNSLTKTGKLYLEVGYNQSDKVCSIFKNEGWDVFDINKDYNHIQRILILKPNSELGAMTTKMS